MEEILFYAVNVYFCHNEEEKKAATTDECSRHVERSKELGISLSPIVVHFLVLGLSCLYSDFECQETILRSL